MIILPRNQERCGAIPKGFVGISTMLQKNLYHLEVSKPGRNMEWLLTAATPELRVSFPRKQGAHNLTIPFPQCSSKWKPQAICTTFEKLCHKMRLISNQHLPLENCILTVLWCFWWVPLKWLFWAEHTPQIAQPKLCELMKRAVAMLSFCAFTLAFASSNSFTKLVCPFWLAMYRGDVLSFLPLLTSAWASIRICTTASWPPHSFTWEAACKGGVLIHAATDELCSWASNTWILNSEYSICCQLFGGNDQTHIPSHHIPSNNDLGLQ